MGIKKQIYAAVLIRHGIFLAQWITTASGAIPSLNSNGENAIGGRNHSNHPQSLFLLGEVEGKHYYVEANQTMNWTEARSYCNASGLRLATIETRNQLVFLTEALAVYPGVFNMLFWTSLRERPSLSMLVWDGTDITASRDVFNMWGWNDRAWEYCGGIRLWLANDGSVDVVSQLDPEESRRRVLCQLDPTN